MASILPGYEYDIFISYRQKDNKGDHWVTEFVNALKTELESAFKEDISIYFDSNPHDGLLETHNVDKSLEGKLKCLIFIPILSQTYCDPKSFAWRDEFCAFNKWAKEDSLGRDIRLSSGNVASRILPIKIHELDVTDKALLENETGGALRSIEFIYREPGVNRPLKLTDNKTDNQNKTDYRNQVNKVANAIKELIGGIQNPKAVAAQKQIGKSEEVPVSARRKLSIAATIIMILAIAGYVLFNFTSLGARLTSEPDKSIAVLPFENMNRDSTQDYFSSGIAEDILNHLVKISDLKVKSRTSTLQYKGTTKTAPVIGDELGVSNIVEGSVRRVGDKVRIVVQLIGTESDNHLWSETYDRDFKDVLSLQSEIAIEIARALQARLTNSEKQDIEKPTTQNTAAYDYFLKAREFRRRGNITRSETESSLSLVNQSIALDKNFSKAYALKALLWFDLSTFGVQQAIWFDSAMQSANQAIVLDSKAPEGHLVKGTIYRYLGDLQNAGEELQLAYSLSPNDPEVLLRYGYLLLRNNKEEGADMILKANESQYSVKDAEYYAVLADAYFYTGDYRGLEQMLIEAKKLNPGAVERYQNLAGLYVMTNQFDKALRELKSAETINPDLAFTIDQLAWTYFQKKDYDNAAKYWEKYPQIEQTFTDTSQTIPFRHRLAMAYSKIGRKKEGDKLVQEDLKIREGLLKKNRSMGSWGNFGSVYYDLAVDHAYLGNESLAVQCLDSAFHYQFYYYLGYDNDPMFENLKTREDFKKVIKKKTDWYKFNQIAFSNALNRAQASKELKGLMEK